MNKIKFYEKLGATWFQKVVFKVEDLKFKFIDKFCPNIDKWYDKKCDRKVEKICAKLDDEEEKAKVRFDFNCRKMIFKRELAERRSVNYHIDINNISKFHEYLLWNKKVHKNGMIKNIFCISACACLIPFLSGGLLAAGITYLVYNLICLGVNFECVNLQNYNICRLDERKEVLDKVEKRRKNRDIENYAKVGEKVYDKMKSQVEIPTSKEVVSSLTTKEELEQLRKLALEIKRQRGKKQDDSLGDEQRVKKINN